MFTIHAVQAEYGDCFIVEYGSAASPRYVLVDGGPPTTYEDHLRGELQSISARGGKLDLAILSHVDNDHIIGLNALADDLHEQQVNNQPGLIGIGALWHNAFSDTIDPANTIEIRVRTLLATSAARVMSTLGVAVLGIAEGDHLRRRAALLGIPVNPGFPNGLIVVDDAPAPIEVGTLRLQIVGPTQANLQALQAEWQAWLDEHEAEIASGDVDVAANADRSIPNLSSIMVLAEADGKRALLTGDGRSDHLLDGLGAAGLLDAQGRLHVDLLKVAHHGSDRNATKTFFKKVTADRYLISANGRDDNPDLATLIWIVETAQQQGRSIEIVVTNRTPSTKKLVAEYPPTDYGYQLTIMPQGAHSVALALAA